MTTLVAVLGVVFTTGFAALIVAIRETVKYIEERRSNQISRTVEQIGAVADRLETENTRLAALNDRQSLEIEKLEQENTTLQINIRSQAQTNMDLGQRLKTALDELDDTKARLNNLLGRLEGGEHVA